MSKRPATDTVGTVGPGGTVGGTTSGQSGQPVLKKSRSVEAPRFTCSTAEELDLNVLKFQNQKLSDRLITRQRLEADLRARIEQSEKKQTSAEAIVYVISRYWNQLNEDVRILLQRFDAETSDENECNNESDATTSFLSQLSNFESISSLANLDTEEMSEQLQQRVDSSTRAIEKVVQAFDRIVQRNVRISAALNGTSSGDDGVTPTLDEAVKAANLELTIENKNLNQLTTQLHEKYRSINLMYSELKDRVESIEINNDDLKNRIDEVEFELNRLRGRELRLEENLTEAKERIRILESEKSNRSPSDGQSKNSSPADGQSSFKRGGMIGLDNVTQAKFEELQREAEEQRELASTRFNELESLNNDHKEALKKIEELKMELKCLPEERVVETAEYKCLQSHFSVLYNESMQLKAQLEETRTQLNTSKNNHLRQIEHMESEELSMQKRLRTEVIQLEDQLAQVRREYEMLHLEFKQMHAANEQTGPINREMRHLITSLQGHNSQLKTEVNRLKKKLKEAQHEVNKLRHEKNELITGGGHHLRETNVSGDTKGQESKPETVSRQDSVKSIGPEKDTSPIKLESIKTEHALKEEPATGDAPDVKPVIVKVEESVTPSIDARAFGELKAQHAQLKSKHESLKSMYESSQNKIKDLKKQLASLSAVGGSGQPGGGATNTGGGATNTGGGAATSVGGVTERRPPDDVQINKLKEKVRALEKQVAAQKAAHQQQEEALLNEMEMTGSAFENMQEMNLRLVQQLREKDDANFKLMSERIKSQQIQKLLKEEKESLTEQVIALQAQVEAQNQVVRKLEEKERLLQNNLSTIEKELGFKQQAMELHKRKAIEAAQSAADLKLHLDKYMLQLKEAQALVADKTKSLQEAMFKKTRLQEEMNSFKRKYERAKKFELASTADEVLLEEIREYKSQLTCPSCQARRKDAVLTKCFHVFCYECLKTRYDTRQRKCPKCTLAFGANDYHKLYLA